MVENETSLNFVENKSMIPHLTDLMSGRRSDGAAGKNYIRLEGDISAHPEVLLEQGFFFLLVVRGAAQAEDVYRSYVLKAQTLLVLTPSVQVVLKEMSADFAFTGLYLRPAYFDSLPDGQALYNQLAVTLGSRRTPVCRLDAAASAYLQNTLSLFAPRLEDMPLYHAGMVRHLCSFLLLQLTELLCGINHDTPVCVSRTNEIFRQFKKLLVQHYKQQHTISFYAAQLHISSTYLSRVVKQITGRTVGDHIAELLCAEARRMLESTDWDVKEIAVALGFSDQSVFGKFFVRKAGLSPLKFRMRRELEKEVSVSPAAPDEEKVPSVGLH